MEDPPADHGPDRGPAGKDDTGADKPGYEHEDDPDEAVVVGLFHDHPGEEELRESVQPEQPEGGHDPTGYHLTWGYPAGQQEVLAPGEEHRRRDDCGNVGRGVLVRAALEAYLDDCQEEAEGQEHRQPNRMAPPALHPRTTGHAPDQLVVLLERPDESDGSGREDDQAHDGCPGRDPVRRREQLRHRTGRIIGEPHRHLQGAGERVHLGNRRNRRQNEEERDEGNERHRGQQHRLVEDGDVTQHGRGIPAQAGPQSEYAAPPTCP